MTGEIASVYFSIYHRGSCHRGKLGEIENYTSKSISRGSCHLDELGEIKSVYFNIYLIVTTATEIHLHATATKKQMIV